MNLEIDQSLHGYSNGHQLLACSRELSIEENRISVLQSDLSGSNVLPGYEEYISGYPIEEGNIYVFSKTWYANEMPRPGCVWTHSLWIKFADLGKIPNFSTLLTYFKRPSVNDFTKYNNPIHCEWSDLTHKDQSSGIVLDTYLAATEFLYDNFESAMLIPSERGSKYESLVLRLWSDQWPRLRRGFTFCTGSLSLKVHNGHPFTLQVIPPENARLIGRSAVNAKIFTNQELPANNSWSNILINTEQLELRKFLWTQGADISGERKNYKPLLLLFQSVLKTDLLAIDKIFRESFPEPNEAKRLKFSVFGPDSSLLTGYEKEKVLFLLSNDMVYLEVDSLSIVERVKELLKLGQLTIDDLISVKSKLITLSPDLIFAAVEHSVELDMKLLSWDLDTQKQIISVVPQIALNKGVWQSDYRVQKEILNTLAGNKLVKNWDPYIERILLSKSAIIYEAYKIWGDQVALATYNFVNNHETQSIIDDVWFRDLIKNSGGTFRNFIRTNSKILTPSFSKKFFDSLEFYDLQFVNLSSDEWLLLYRKLSDPENASTESIAAINILSLALRNNMTGSEWIVAEVFEKVFTLAEKSKIPNPLWTHLPKKDIRDDIDKEFSLGGFVKGLFGIDFSEKHRAAATWDYCEILLRTVCSSFIQYKWSEQAFVNSLSKDKEFVRAIQYIKTFYSGRWFVLSLHDAITRGRVNATKRQLKVIKD